MINFEKVLVYNAIIKLILKCIYFFKSYKFWYLKTVGNYMTSYVLDYGFKPLNLFGFDSLQCRNNFLKLFILCVLLWFIFTNKNFLLQYLQKKNRYCIDFFIKKYIKNYVEIILWYLFSIISYFFEDFKSFDFKEIEKVLVSIICEKTYEYRSIINCTKIEKNGNIATLDKIDKEK